MNNNVLQCSGVVRGGPGGIANGCQNKAAPNCVLKNNFLHKSQTFENIAMANNFILFYKYFHSVVGIILVILQVANTGGRSHEQSESLMLQALIWISLRIKYIIPTITSFKQLGTGFYSPHRESTTILYQSR